MEIRITGEELLHDLYHAAKKNGGMAKLVSTTEGIMPLYVEIAGSEILGLPETLVIAHYKIVNGDSLCDPRMTFALINHKYIPVSWQNDFAGMNKTILQWNDEKEDWLVSDPPALLAAINFFNTVWMDNIASFYEF